MTAMTEPIGLAEGRPFTVHDLEAMPDDGRRYELIDGMLLVTPAPGWSHQEMSATLYRVLHAACLPELRVLLAPFAVRTAPINEVQPDVLVARYDDLTEACLPVAPVFVAETLSRSTQLNDRNPRRRTTSGWGWGRTGCLTRSSRVGWRSTSSMSRAATS
jgi:Uma2 family endonuclease